MPAAYAHYRFGCQVQERLTQRQCRRIVHERQLFDFGVHGPDLLFYYRPLSQNMVNQMGQTCHSMTGRQFFDHAAEIFGRHPQKAAARSYLYGAVCHFALDRQCHPYVAEKEAQGQVSHLAIEASFDRFLMEQDGLDPLRTRLTAHLYPGRRCAGVIAPFFAPVTASQLEKAQRSMVRTLNLLCPPPGPARFLLESGIHAIGKGQLADLLIPQKPNSACADSDQYLLQLYEGAIDLAVTLLHQLDQKLDEGAVLGSGFDHTFEEI
ncbi:MAG: zinc dependent phospholipase C family protein [Pygmaiobacter massiliensis]|nr:zinc dependent phospholipase C family protein [Pygmaiobacter massiliensis]